MTYRELLSKYKEGTLLEEEKLLVEQELEKSEAINDYLAEDIEQLFEQRLPGRTNITVEQSKIEKSIKRTVYKRLATVVALSVACVFIITLMSQYILSPLVSSQYYNPTKKTAGQKYFQDFANDIRIITEVSMPGYGISGGAYAENLGFGKYNIAYDRKNLFTKETEKISGQLNKNRIVGSPGTTLYVSRGNFVFTEFWNGEEGGTEYERRLSFSKNNTNVQIAHIKELPDTSYISAWVRFTDDLTMKELNNIKESNNEIQFKWIAVRTAEKQGQQLMGFSTDPNGSFVTNDKVDSDRYPGLQLVDLMGGAGYSLSTTESPMPGYYETHYISSLKYLVDHKEAVTTLVGVSKSFDYKSALSYAMENGVSTYGALIFGEADELLDFYDSGIIMTLEIDNVIASKYIK
jgi:hypothetical protein